ncbi:MAG: carboxylesterase family protein, partial [Vicinamibacterales bacterium]
GLSMARMRTRAAAEQPDPRCGVPFGQTPPASAPPSPSLVQLRAKPAAEVAKTLCGAGMIVDGWIVPEDLSITFAQGRQNAVDVLVGSNKDEGAFSRRSTAEQWTGRVKDRWGERADAYSKLYPGSTDAEAAASAEAAFADEMFWHMRLFADAQTKRGKKAWLYYFTHEPPTHPAQRNLRATHSAEIPYVFNNLKAPRVFPDTSSPELTSASPRDRALAETVSSYWVNFARSGDPNTAGLAHWPAFRDGRTSMILGDVVPVPSSERLALYDALYAKQMASTRQPSR